MAQRGLLAAVGAAAVTLGAGAKALGSRSARVNPDPTGLGGKFRSFLSAYVPPTAAPALWSMFARWTTAGRIDLSKTRSLSDLLHQMHRALCSQQTRENKRYFQLMKAFREGVKAWESQLAAEERTRVRLADELKLSEKAREARQLLG